MSRLVKLLTFQVLITTIITIVFIVLYILEKRKTKDDNLPVYLFPTSSIAPFVTNNVFATFKSKVQAKQSIRMLCIGDSTTEVGSGGLGGYGTYPYQLASLSSVPAISEAFSGSHTSDPRLTLSNPNSMVSNLATLGGNIINLSNTGDTLKYGPTSKSFGYKIYMLTGSNACDVSVTLSTTLFGDSGPTTQTSITLSCYDPTQTNLAVKSFNVQSTAIKADAMYLTMTPTNLGSGRSAMFVAIETINAPNVQLSILNGGLSGTTTNDVADNSAVYSPINMISQIGADINIVMLGINDWYISKTPIPQFAANLRLIYTAAKSTPGAEVLVVTPVPSNTSFIAQADQDAYVQAIRRVAADMKLPLFDQYALWGTFDRSDAAGWMKDALHPNERGIHQMVNAIRFALGI